MNVNRLLRKNIRQLSAYVAKEIPCRVKLDANESPYEFPSFLQSIDDIKTNRYPDPEARILKREAARRWKTGARNILLGNGSDEIIYYLITTFGGPVLYPTPTFSMYGIIAKAIGEKTIGIPLDRDFDLSLDAMLRAVKREKPKLIFLSTPNNPTGNCFSSERILKLIDRTKGLVVIDEAYYPFSSRKGMLPLLRDYKNALFMRTLSKIGFASLRVGFLIAHEEIIEAVNRVRLPFNVNALSQRIAIQVFKNYREIDRTIKAICRERDRVFRELSSIESIEVFPSEANFILFRVRNAPAIHKKLLKKGVLIRDMSSQVRDSLRVTIGTPEENDIFLEKIAEVLQ
ncbi:MAG: histidinol-phosphate transaminase [Nitrospirae bacterium]|nr:histidinol-phosphate transaminase [Nitrospirota bacterium]